jgi:hypothetical protein
MGATRESTTTQVLEWAVGKLSEASKTDWMEKLSALSTSRPAYLRGVTVTPPAGGGSRAELDQALDRAARAEARAAQLEKRVAELEQQLAQRPAADGQGEEHHKTHWWTRILEG